MFTAHISSSAKLHRPAVRTGHKHEIVAVAPTRSDYISPATVRKMPLTHTGYHGQAIRHPYASELGWIEHPHTANFESRLAFINGVLGCFDHLPPRCKNVVFVSLGAYRCLIERMIEEHLPPEHAKDVRFRVIDTGYRARRGNLRAIEACSEFLTAGKLPLEKKSAHDLAETYLQSEAAIADRHEAAVVILACNPPTPLDPAFVAPKNGLAMSGSICAEPEQANTIYFFADRGGPEKAQRLDAFIGAWIPGTFKYGAFIKARMLFPSRRVALEVAGPKALEDFAARFAVHLANAPDKPADMATLASACADFVADEKAAGSGWIGRTLAVNEYETALDNLTRFFEGRPQPTHLAMLEKSKVTISELASRVSGTNV